MIIHAKLFFNINGDMCKLGFCPLSTLGGFLDLELRGPTEDCSQTVAFCFFCALQSVSVVEWGGLFQWSWWCRERMIQVLGLFEMLVVPYSLLC
jgi:hypothetical protein